jgi:hypothetical protein
MKHLDYLIRAVWLPDGEDTATIGLNALRTLEDLERIDPVFSRWSFSDPTIPPEDATYESRIPMTQARGRIKSLVESGVRRNDYGEPTPKQGYRLSASNSVRENDREPPQRTHFGVIAGSQSVLSNSLKFTTGTYFDAADPAITTYPIYRQALEVLASNWPCPWACAYGFNTHYFERSVARGVPPVPYSMFHMAWIAYISAPLAASIKPPTELVTERTPGGGLILSAVRERLDPTNPDHMRRCRLLVDLMRTRVGEDNRPARAGPF